MYHSAEFNKGPTNKIHFMKQFTHAPIKNTNIIENYNFCTVA